MKVSGDNRYQMSWDGSFTLNPMRKCMMSDIYPQLVHAINTCQEGTKLSHHSYLLFVVDIPSHSTWPSLTLIVGHDTYLIILACFSRWDMQFKHLWVQHWFLWEMGKQEIPVITGGETPYVEGKQNYYKGMWWDYCWAPLSIPIMSKLNTGHNDANMKKVWPWRWPQTSTTPQLLSPALIMVTIGSYVTWRTKYSADLFEFQSMNMNISDESSYSCSNNTEVGRYCRIGILSQIVSKEKYCSGTGIAKNVKWLH